MRFDYFVRQHNVLYNISRQIIRNSEYKNNFYHIPPNVLEERIMQQKHLIDRYIRKNEITQQKWVDNKGCIYDYLFHIHDTN